VPGGWFIDNIQLTASAFQPVATVAGDLLHRQAQGRRRLLLPRHERLRHGRRRLAGAFEQRAERDGLERRVLMNVAAAANGATATASSSYSSSFPASSAIDGVRSGLNWGAGGGWNDQTREVYPDWLEVAFGGTKRVGQIRVYTLPDGYGGSSEPTDVTTATQYGLVDFDVQYWDGDSWETVPGGAVRGNTLAVRAVVLADDVVTDRIRVLVHNSRMYFSRVVEVEAAGCDALP
jgi:F5/8 type C domain.